MPKKLFCLFLSASSLVFSLSAVAEEDKVSPLQIDGAVTVDAAEAKKLFDAEAVIVDVRTDKDWDAGRIPGAVHLELKSRFTEEALLAEVGKNDDVMIYCNGSKCLRSSEASSMAVEWGFKKVYFFRGGIPEWKAANLPIE